MDNILSTECNLFSPFGVKHQSLTHSLYNIIVSYQDHTSYIMLWLTHIHFQNMMMRHTLKKISKTCRNGVHDSHARFAHDFFLAKKTYWPKELKLLWFENETVFVCLNTYFSNYCLLLLLVIDLSCDDVLYFPHLSFQSAIFSSCEDPHRWNYTDYSQDIDCQQ